MTDHVDLTAHHRQAKLDPVQIAFWVAIAFGVAAAGVAISAGASVGRAGAILLLLLMGGGMALFYWMSRGGGRNFGAFPERGVIAAAALHAGRGEHAFLEALDEPAMVTDASLSPLAANQAYYTLAETAGALGDSDRPPMMNRLFGADPLLSAPMFRLSKAAGALSARREVLPPTSVAPGAQHVRYEATVGPMPNGRVLWRLREVGVRGDTVNHDEARRLFLDDAPVGFFTARPDGTILYMNRSLRAVLDIREGAGSLRVKDIFKDDAARFIRRDKRGVGGAPVRVTLKGADGLETPASAMSFWAADESDGSARTLIFFAEHEPQARERIARDAAAPASYDARALEHAPFGAAMLDGADPASATLLDSNPALMEITQGRATPGAAFADLFDASEGPTELTQKLRKAVNKPVELMLATTPPISAHVHFSRTDDGKGLAYVVNVTEQRELEQRLAQSEKMREIGELAAGVAHDFNNMLTVVMQTCSYLLRRHPVGDADHPMLQEISDHATSARELSEMLRAYARQQTFAREVFQVSDFIGQRQELFRRIVGDTVGFSIRHTPDLPFVKVDKAQLERVVVNLCTNARDAMNAKGGSGGARENKLAIRTSITTAEAARALGHNPIEDGQYVLIEVEDTGSGIKPENQAKIFRPFHTTKEGGKGTGLGLATSYGIIKQSGGYIFFDSKMGVGTTFRIFLAAYEPTADDLNEIAERERASRPGGQDVAGRGQILFVEDLAPVRRSIVRNLIDCGYEVEEAENGEEALEKLQSNPGKYDLIISDVAMPIMTGPEMLRAAGMEMIGRAKVLFLSGYAPESFSDMLEEYPVAYMSKPVTMEQLVARVKQVLAS